jgi:hypothetical protein
MAFNAAAPSGWCGYGYCTGSCGPLERQDDYPTCLQVTQSSAYCDRFKAMLVSGINDSNTATVAKIIINPELIAIITMVLLANVFAD